MLPTLLLVLQVGAGAPDTSRISAVRAAVEREPVEAMGEERGFVRAGDIALLDLDSAGAQVAFVAIVPKFRQTPTVLVYTLGPGGPTRLLEGLVPGGLQPVSGHFIDDHTLGLGLDLTAGDLSDRATIAKIIASAARTGFSLVRYRTFVHADHRSGFRAFADLADRTLPPGNDNTCGDFEFSTVQQLLSGSLAGSAKRYLVALTTKDITIYRFLRINPDGTLEKQSWIRSRPREVARIEAAANGDVVLSTADGRVVPLAAP